MPACCEYNFTNRFGVFPVPPVLPASGIRTLATRLALTPLAPSSGTPWMRRPVPPSTVGWRR